MGRKVSQSNARNGKPTVVRVNSPEALLEVTWHFGNLIPIRQAALMAGVSRQRIHHLLGQGRFTRILWYDEPTISYLEFREWLESGNRVRKCRPRKEMENIDPEAPPADGVKTP